MSTFDLTFYNGQNLISFPIQLDDSSIESVFDDDRFIGVIREGEATTQISPGTWVGSLTNIIPTSGYWVNIDLGEGGVETFTYEGPLLSPDITYGLRRMWNLISFPHTGCVELNPVFGEGAILEEFSGEDGKLTKIIKGDMHQH